MTNSKQSVALRSTGQRVFPLYDVSARYTLVRIPPAQPGHNPSDQVVLNENLKEVQSTPV